MMSAHGEGEGRKDDIEGKRRQRNRGSYERKKREGGEKESWGWIERFQVNGGKRPEDSGEVQYEIDL